MNDSTKDKKYQIQDIKTGFLLGSYATRVSANKIADKKNKEYGAHRYSVSFI